MSKSAGLLLFRRKEGKQEYFLVHPGGPFFKKKDAGWWTVPKGLINDQEDPLAAALREFEEETGHVPDGNFIPLSPIKQKGGKEVLCWAVEGDMDPSLIVSNMFTIEWPPRSGKITEFPEVDKAGWFDPEEAGRMINEKQKAFLNEAEALLSM